LQVRKQCYWRITALYKGHNLLSFEKANLGHSFILIVPEAGYKSIECDSFSLNDDENKDRR
jgi:hypothetical protein